MVVVTNKAGATQSLVTAGGHRLEADTRPPAGREAGVRPHQLLESALGSCMAITLRMVADERRLALDAATVTVTLDRGDPAAAVFRASVQLDGALTAAERAILLHAAQNCPVLKTLSRRLSFETAEDGGADPPHAVSTAV